MITEDYVSFETAKLLKEKGFNEPCKVWYSEYTSQFGGEKYTSIEFDDHNRFKKNYKFLFHAPTHQMAIKWLREKDIRICPDYSDVDGKWFTMIGTKKKRTYSGYYDTYEEAIEVALKYSLENLI